MITVACLCMVAFFFYRRGYRVGYQAGAQLAGLAREGLALVGRPE